MRKRIDLEYIFSSSVTILFSRLSSAPGLAEWFSDDVKHDGNIFTFVWDGIGEEAELVDMKKNSYVRFKWLDADDEEEFFEFSLHVEPLTEEVALIITDLWMLMKRGIPLNYGINRSKCYIARLVDKVFFYLCEFVYHE